MKNDTITDFFTHIDNIIENDLKDSFYKIPLRLNKLKRKIFKLSASEILQNGNMLNTKINNYFYNYVETIDTKTYKFKQITQKIYKCSCIIKFDNKAFISH